MAVQFSVRIKAEGKSNGRPYIGKDGKAVANLIIGAIEEQTLDITGKMIAMKGLEASERVLKLNAIFFQRVVSRTPRDETYHYRDKKGHLRTHKDDGDYIQDYWTAAYGTSSPISAKYLRDNCGCTFENFNDPSEIETIYKEFRRFLGKSTSAFFKNGKGGRTFRGVRIYNDYPKDKQHELRYHLLEYGGYVGDGIIKEKERPHGVVGGRSIQAPAGMLALTKAEFEGQKFNIPTEDLFKYLKRVKKMKSYSTLKRLLKGHVRFTQDDLAKIMEVYGV